MEFQIIKQPIHDGMVKYPGLYKVFTENEEYLVVTFDKWDLEFLSNNLNFSNVLIQNQRVYFNRSFSENIAREVYKSTLS